MTLVIAVGFLVVTYSAFSGSQAPGSIDQAMSNIDMLQKLLVVGCMAAIVGTTYMFWGEETLPISQLVVAASLFFAPLYLPAIMGGASSPSKPGAAALATIQLGGIVLGILAILVLVADSVRRVKERAKQSSRTDQLKREKGIKEEKYVSFVLMGKTWHLPKIVSERSLQERKYRVLVLYVIAAFAGVYVLLRDPLLAMVGGMVGSMDKVFASMTYQKPGQITGNIAATSLPIVEVLLICFMIIALSYALKIVEHVIFKPQK